MQQQQTPPFKPSSESLFAEERQKFNKPLGMVNIAILVFFGLVLLVGIILVYVVHV
ncbi:MAG TPA: hypothetical protein VIZ18_18515 [Ktedonobacteraceae bacterium]